MDLIAKQDIIESLWIEALSKIIKILVIFYSIFVIIKNPA
jgi:hypothetical protein